MKVKSFFATCVCGVFLFGVTSSANESEKLLADGNFLYQKYLETKDVVILDRAYLNYYKASQIEPSASSYLGMGMVFIEKKMTKKAKKYLYKAYSIDENDAVANYYLAKFSFENEDYLRALFFYKKAYANGLADNYDVNEKLGTIYEKVGDTERAKLFYRAALNLNPNSEHAQNRLNALDYFENKKYLYLQN
ncbi:hypothetical protein IJE86_05215 [bacterium]|nr:hypothetical protein [bacterium]